MAIDVCVLFGMFSMLQSKNTWNIHFHTHYPTHLDTRSENSLSHKFNMRSAAAGLVISRSVSDTRDDGCVVRCDPSHAGLPARSTCSRDEQGETNHSASFCLNSSLAAAAAQQNGDRLTHICRTASINMLVLCSRFGVALTMMIIIIIIITVRVRIRSPSNRLLCSICQESKLGMHRRLSIKQTRNKNV